MSDLDGTNLEGRMRSDPRTNDELISAALLHARDDDPYWDTVFILRRRDTTEARRYQQLCRSDVSAERRLGADIIGQLGVPERIFPGECLSILLAMLKAEEDTAVLPAILIALGHLHRIETIESVLPFSKHPDPAVRHGVVSALTGYEEQRAIDELISLSHDGDAHVRDWATFGLGTISDLDTPAIRNALAERLTDADYDTRCEAIVGLAKRKDARVVPVIVKELTSNDVGNAAVEATTLMPLPEFYPGLVALKEWWDVDVTLLDEAITACCPKTATTVGP
jgi:HEAT repeat protein